ncbi:MAG: type II secretion system major pseudopilin GspG [Phycisphaerales bacterium]
MHRAPSPRLRRGFTILELLIVIGILLALGGIVLYNLTGQSEKANVGIAKEQMLLMKKAMGMFRVDVKRLPTKEEGLAALWDKSVLDEEVAKAWQGPYLEEAVPKDLWGHEWIYEPSEEAAIGFDIISIGPDGQEGTEDDIHLVNTDTGDGAGSSSGTGSRGSSSSGSGGTGGGGSGR